MTTTGFQIKALLLMLASGASGCASTQVSNPSPQAEKPAPTQAPPAVLTQQPIGSIDEALALRAQGQPAEGLAMLEWVRADALARGDAATAAWALHRGGDLAADLEQWQKASSAYQQALEEHLKNGDVAAASRAANDLGLLAQGGAPGCSQGSEDGRSWFRKAIELAVQAGEWDRARRAANNLGVTLFYSERFDEADQVWSEALGYAEKGGDAAGGAQEHTNLALLWALRAEGGFPTEGPEAEPPKVDPTSDAERKARQHFAAAREAAESAGRDPGWVCAMFGRYGNRCGRLAEPPPQPKPLPAKAKAGKKAAKGP